jgi:hypothetical protein
MPGGVHAGVEGGGVFLLSEAALFMVGVLFVAGVGVKFLCW